MAMQIINQFYNDAILKFHKTLRNVPITFRHFNSIQHYHNTVEPYRCREENKDGIYHALYTSMRVTHFMNRTNNSLIFLCGKKDSPRCCRFPEGDAKQHMATRRITWAVINCLIV